MTYSKILPRLYVGSTPCGPADLKLLHEELGVTAVLNLQTDDDLRAQQMNAARLEKSHQKYGMEMHRLPIRDFHSEDLREKLPAAASILCQLLRLGHVVFVHCTEGVGRSPSIVIAYLHWFRAWRLRAAERHLQRHHPCMPNLNAIRLAQPPSNAFLRFLAW